MQTLAVGTTSLCAGIIETPVGSTVRASGFTAFWTVINIVIYDFLGCPRPSSLLAQAIKQQTLGFLNIKNVIFSLFAYTKYYVKYFIPCII